MQSPELTAFRPQLLAWFRQFQRDLPWRQTRDPYCIWLSEIMLQQTRVAVVIPYYERFLKRFPDVRTLAEAPEEEVLRHWSGLGYYSRARNLQKAAREIVLKHDGEFPRNAELVLKLPGIGTYTVAAILSIAFGQKLAVLDGNVARVIARLEAIRGDLRASWKTLQLSADRLLAPDCAGDWNQAMMELGATLCKPIAPRCLLCPVSAHCRARKLGLSEIIPEKGKKREAVEVTLVAAILLNAKRETLLLPPAKLRGRSSNDVPTLVSGMWHFPTVSAGKNTRRDLSSLLRQLTAKPKLRKWNCLALPGFRHTVTYRKLMVLPFVVGVSRLPSISGSGRFPLSEVTCQPISNLTRKIARAALNLRRPGG